MKKYSIIVLFNITVIVFLFLLLELSVRIFVPQLKLSGVSSDFIIDSLYSDSPGIRPNTTGYSEGVVKQSNGYNAWKYFKPVSVNKRKLLFLGDSVTMGISVENDSTYAGIINNYSDSLSVINPSLIGYSSKDYLNVFNYFIASSRFDLKFSSVMMFWTLNDIYSNYPDNKSPELSSYGFLNNVINFLRRNSKAYHFLKDLISDRPRAYYEYDKQYYTEYNPLLVNSVRNIEQISSVCDSLKIKFELILLPYEFQIRNFDKKGIFLPQNILSRELSNKHIKIIDLREIFRNYAQISDKFYLYGDGIHFNKRGNFLIASDLKNFL